MRITHATRQYAPGIGGMENYVALLAQEQRRAGHQVRVVTLDRIFDGDGTRLPAREVIDGIEVVRVPFRGSRRYPLAPGVVGAVGRPDVIHVHGLEFFAEALGWTRWRHRAALVMTSHGGIFHTPFAMRMKRLWFATISRATLTRYHTVIASSLQDADSFGRIAAGRVVPVENGVDVAKFAGLAQPGTKTMIYFGRLAPHKGVHRLLAWFAGLREVDPAWRLIVAGKEMGVTIAELRLAARELALDDVVEFHGSPSDEALCDLIARSSVYACPSGYEGFGLAAVEAASAGLFPVLSGIPAFRRTLDRLGTGLTIGFDYGREVDVFLEALAAFEADAGRAERLAAPLASFAWSGIADEIERIYRSATGGRGGVRPAPWPQEATVATVP